MSWNTGPFPGYLLILLSIMLCFMVVNAGAASFDCTKAQHPVEKAICADRELSRLDEDLAVLYKGLRKSMSGDAGSQDALKKNQQKWVREVRNSGRSDASFLLKEYRERAETLSMALNLEKIMGAWISKQYADTVASTRAPQKAADSIGMAGILSFELTREQGKYLFAGTTFHEGISHELTGMEEGKAKGAFTIIVSGPEVMVPTTVEVPVTISVDSQGIAQSITGNFIPGSNSTPEHYIRIPRHLKEYLNRTVLAGAYTDASGRAYSFSEAGMAVWPNRIFEYELVPDSTESGCEYFKSLVRGDRIEEGQYGYAWKDGKLELYDIVDGALVNGPPISCSKKPIMILTPQGK